MSIRTGLRVAALALLSGPAAAAEPGFVEQLHRAVVAADYGQLSTLHGQLGENAPSDDGQTYLWAYAGWRLTQHIPKDGAKQRKKLLKLLQQTLQGYLERNPDDAEAMALLGSVLGDRITGPLSAMRLGSKAGETLEAAYQLAGSNPRVALQRGVGYFFTPKAFGGGAEKAEQELKRALELYESGDGTGWPNWGYLDTLARLGEVLADQGKRDEARQMYSRALDLEPEFVWVKNELLPALDSTG